MKLLTIRQLLISALLFLFLALAINAQKTEITISLNEQFFDALLDAIYQNSPPPEFQLSRLESGKSYAFRRDFTGKSYAFTRDFNDKNIQPDITSKGSTLTPSPCGSVTLLRENKSMRTAVRFRDGKIYAPVAFTGSQNMPLVGCVDFAGYAESNIDLQFDRDTQKLIGRVKVLNVNINGTAGIGGSLIARMIQSSIDKKLNPIEIVSLDKLSFPFTLQNSAKLKLQATGVRHEIAGSALNIIISYEFVKE